MEPGELVLSDVHITVPFELCPDNDVPSCSTCSIVDQAGHGSNPMAERLAVTRFEIYPETSGMHTNKLTDKLDDPEARETTLHIDEDGDMLPVRHCKAENSDHVTIGVLDLGSGVGLTSIMAARCGAKTVYCTDMDKGILSLAAYNVTKFSTVDRVCDDAKPDIRIHILDWEQETLPDTGSFCWTLENAAEMRSSVAVILAADVSQFQDDYTRKLLKVLKLVRLEAVAASNSSQSMVYDDDLTDAFFRTIYHLLKRPPAKVLYASIEKRYVFTMHDRDTVAPAYEHFLACLSQLRELSDEHVLFTAQCLQCDFPQRISYTRTKQMELWEIRSSFVT